MKYNIPDVGEYEINTIVLDLNGTLSVNGIIEDDTIDKLSQLKELGFEIILLTGDQRGTAQGFCDKLGLTLLKAKNGEDKTELMKQFNPETTAAIGNARIDIGTFKGAKISIATLQSEGIHTGIIEHVDIIIPRIQDALNIFIEPDVMAATMRV
ncbi:HAD family hydrolase [Candidatus Gracilibacteria bacterium]|nr:HAD family hydrolase [Candidatus Gracilibacteria bacterium]